MENSKDDRPYPPLPEILKITRNVNTTFLASKYPLKKFHYVLDENLENPTIIGVYFKDDENAPEVVLFKNKINATKNGFSFGNDGITVKRVKYNDKKYIIESKPAKDIHFVFDGDDHENVIGIYFREENYIAFFNLFNIYWFLDTNADKHLK